ncbi:MAG: hypothetical protein JRG91_19695 [Deltaproteobacteria bacterium]|nr:hypothetical protein [Deltaproteobacteria bacterium]
MTRFAAISITILSLLAARCGGAGDGPTFDAGSDQDAEEESGCESCSSHDECDDGVACTRDTCVIGGCCEHQPDDGECPPGEVCDPDVGCVSSECSTDGDCDDGLDCTLDTCLVDHTCSHTDTCPTGQRCTEAGCEEIVPCSTDEECIAHDGDFCNGDEWCDPEFGCQPAVSPRECADDDDCTVDTCDTDLGMCVFECDPCLEGCLETCDFDPYDGCFSLGTTIAQRCAFGMVNYSFNQVCLERVGPALSMSAGMFVLSDTAPGALSFSAVLEIAGDCNERYTITGTFTDCDHFDGDWTAEFYPPGSSSCLLSSCSPQDIPITGTRLP